MSGGNFTFQFDRENSIYTARCLPHDTLDIFRMMTDCALEPKNFNTANVGQEKVKASYKVK